MSLGRMVEIPFLLLSFGMITGARWASIVSPSILNVDESQAVANTLRILRHGYSWNAMDPQTAGPLTSAAMLWPHLFGLDATHATARLTAALLLAVIATAVFDAGWTLAGRRVGALSGAAVVVFAAGARSNELRHMSTELLGVALITVAFALVERDLVVRDLVERDLVERDLTEGAGRIAGARRSITLGLLLGAAPLAKLQMIVLAAALGLVAVLHRRHRPGQMAWLTGAAIVPFALYLVPLLLTGTIDDFLIGHLEYATVYVNDMTGARGLWAMTSVDPLLRALTVASIVGLATVLVAIVRSARVRGRRGSAPSALCLVLFALGVYSAARPGNPFPHYLFLALPFGVLLPAAANRLWVPGPDAAARRGRWRPTLVRAQIFGLVALLAIALGMDRPPSADRVPGPSLVRRADLFHWVADPGETMTVWGWAPQWYVASGLVPATRQTQNFTEIDRSRLRPWFRRRFLREFARASPAIVMDAITPHSTWFTDPQADGLPGFPELQKLVSSRYELLSGGYKNPGCPGTWARHDVAERLRRRTVPFARITADANIYSEGDVYGARNLDDFSVAEDLCRDEWLLPDARQASVRLDFTQREKVRQVLLLNTHNDGASDRSSRVVRVTLFDHTRTAYRTDVTMAAHPRWTVVTLPTPTDAVALQIDVLSWHGFGGGLNEVKVWR